jgi:hypothetical protein
VARTYSNPNNFSGIRKARTFRTSQSTGGKDKKIYLPKAKGESCNPTVSTV